MNDARLTERQEAEIALAERQQVDAISDVVGSGVYSARHRFQDLREALFEEARHGSLAVSRFYFSVDPRVVVDIEPKPGMVAREIAAKRAYCERNGIRYVLIADPFDDVGVRAQLAHIDPDPEPPTAVVKPHTTVNRPRTTASQKRRAKAAA